MEKKPQHIEKENQVAELQQLFVENDTVILTDYRGISVSQDVSLRKKLREAGVEYMVAKNTLIKRASNNHGIEALNPYLEGPTAIAFSKDPVAAAKILGDFIKEARVTSFKAGILTGSFIDAAGIDALAKLPPREVLLAQIAGCFAAPMSALARVTNLVKEQKEAAGDAPAAAEAPVEAAPAEEAPAEAAVVEEAAAVEEPAEAAAEEAAPEATE